jgi:hypothetical protein
LQKAQFISKSHPDGHSHTYIPKLPIAEQMPLFWHGEEEQGDPKLFTIGYC